MNTAKKYLHALMDVPEHDEARLDIAVEQTRAMRDRYAAPHKYRGTPARLHKPRVGLTKRLFKGHRA